MKKNIFFMFVFIFISGFQTSFPEEQVEDVLFDVINHLKDLNVQTGDLLFWSSNEIDSVLIQRFTEGVYSHAGILSVTPDGKIVIYDVHPGDGLRRSYIENHFGLDQGKLVSMAVVRYKGILDRQEISKRLDEFWARRAQIQFDQSMALEEGVDYASLLRGENLSLYCTEFIYLLYDGASSGPVFFENDYPRVYLKKDLITSIPMDSEIISEFKLWLGIRPVEQFQKWLTSHQSQVLISANGMLRPGGFEILYEKHDRERLKPWAIRLLETSLSDTPVAGNS